MPLSITDQLAGSLLGQALGDALGFVVEGAPPEQAVAYVGCWLRAGRAVERGHDPFPFGQYSDDTQLARELLLVFRQAGRFDPALFAARIAELFRHGADVGAGPGTRAAAHRLLRGIP
jgi:ADP-ribosylglycohydrolase